MIVSESLIRDLEDAIASGSADKRVDALRRVTDLFVAGAGRYTEQHVALFDDVIDRLAREIEVDVKAELARRLAPIDNAPVKVIHALAFDDIVDVAGPVLTQSKRLNEQDLVDSARIKGPGHLLAIAQRTAISEAVTDVLVVRGDQAVVRSVVGNEGARFSDAGFGILIERSNADELLAERVGLREDIPRHHLRALIAKASETVLERLTAARPDAVGHVRQALAEVTSRIEAEAAAHDYAEAEALVAQLRKSDGLGEEEVKAFARARRFKETVAALSLLGGLPIEAIERAMLDGQTDVILIVAKAAGLTWNAARLVVLLQGGRRGVAPSDLERAQQSFERLQAETARRVVRFYQGRGKPGGETH